LPSRYFSRVLISVLGIAMILSYLYTPSNSTAQFSGLESSQTSQMPIVGAGNFSVSRSSYSPAQQPSHREILSSNFNATSEAEYIEQCDSAVPQSMERRIQSQGNNATVLPYFKTHETSNFDILGRLVIQYPNNWGVSNNSLGYPQFYTLDDPYTFLYVNCRHITNQKLDLKQLP
jgi:hypothetical protein